MRLDIYQYSNKLYALEIPAIDLENGSEVYIGRSDDCHVVLDDQQVSRHHAILKIENGKLLLKKLSQFGSMSVNGNEVSEYPLNNGDRFIITDYTIQIDDIPSNTVIPKDDIPEPTPLEETKSQVDDIDSLLGEDTPGEDTQLRDEFENSIDENAEEEKTEEFSNNFDDEEEAQASTDSDEFDDSPLGEENQFSAEENNGFQEETNEFASEEGGEGFESHSDEEGFGEVSDDGFGDDGFGDGFGGDTSDTGESTQVFQSFARYTLTIDGEYAPFDRYTIEDKEIFIGRDQEKCQIVLNDPEVSGVHAIIRKTLINCILEDQNSSNGTILNGERINKAELTNGDNFQIGSTIFSVQIKSDLLEAEQDILMPVEDNQEIEVEEVVEEEVDFDEVEGGDGEFGVIEEVQEKSLIKRIWKDPKKRRYVIFGAVGLMLLMLLSEDPAPTGTATKGKAAKAKDAKAQGVQDPNKAKPKEKELSPEVKERLEENYALALAKYEAGEYYEAKEYLEVIKGIDPNYKETQTLLKLVQQGYEELLRIKAEEEAEKERKKRQLKIQALLEKTKEAVEKREVQVAESLFGQILEIDPENIDVPQLKMEIEAYKAEQEKKRLDEERKKAERKRMVDALAPGKTLFLRGDWYKAIDKLEKFTKEKGMDEDLIKEATDMLLQSRKKLSALINPLLGRARSYKEGQDLKRAYETYGEVLRYDPSHEEALNERDSILDNLETRSRKLYREALISESLSLFEEAKEKFQEVQQISPINSEYYNKATDKLKNYLE